jgi:hypothetical protein
MRGISWLAAKTGQLLKDSAPWSSSSSSVTSSSTHCICSIIVFQRITRVDKHTFSRTLLDLESARCTELYLKNGQYLQNTNIHTPA